MLWEIGASYYTVLNIIPSSASTGDDYSLAGDVYNGAPPNVPQFARTGFIDMSGYRCTAVSTSSGCSTNNSEDAAHGSTPGTNPNPVGTHNGNANYLLCDGHVKWLPSNSVSGGANAQYPTSTEGAGSGIDAEGGQVGQHSATFSAI